MADQDEKGDVEKISEELESVSLSEASSTASVGDVEPVAGAIGEGTQNCCCICRERCVNPVRLPCSHVFCYLCIKGVAARNSHCALCRQRIRKRDLDNPSVVNRADIQDSVKKSSESQGWYYESKSGGWWMYEQRTSAEIEKAYESDQKSLRLQIAGFYYIIDFENMVQYREEMPNRRRQIKRDKVSEDTIKGVAGIPVAESSASDQQEAVENDEEGSTTSSSEDSTTPPESEQHRDPDTDNPSRLVTGHD